MIISNKLATLREIKEYYSYSDCVDLQDIILTDSYNQRIIHAAQEEKAKRNK